MHYLALYRKYRPNSFDEMVGQDKVVNVIKNEILNNRFHLEHGNKNKHSYNALSAIFSTRFVFSKSGDFDIINELLKADNTIFDRPNITLSWNGQTYYPQGK